MLKDNPGSAERIAPHWLYLAFCEHDSVAAARALAVFGNKTLVLDAVVFGRAYYEGLLARMKGDAAAAHAAFTEARAAQEQIVAERINKMLEPLPTQEELNELGEFLRGVADATSFVDCNEPAGLFDEPVPAP
jgi:hypothetical protein